MVHELHVTHKPQFFTRPDLNELRSMIGALLERPTSRVWLAADGDETVGYVVAEIRSRDSTPITTARRWLEVDQLGVLPVYRRKGIAKVLIEKVLETAETEGITDVDVGTWAFNKVAHETFERLGFRPMTNRYTRKVGD